MMAITQDEKSQKEKEPDEKIKIQELLDKVKSVREFNPAAKGYVLVFKKGDLAGNAANIVRDYVHRHFGPVLILELNNPDKDFKMLELS